MDGTGEIKTSLQEAQTLADFGQILSSADLPEEVKTHLLAHLQHSLDVSEATETSTSINMIDLLPQALVVKIMRLVGDILDLERTLHTCKSLYSV